MEAASEWKKRAILPSVGGGVTGAASLSVSTSCQRSSVKVSRVSSTYGMGCVLSHGCGLSGEAWHREVYIMNADGTNARVLSPVGGNSQGPSISPDGKWIAFTAYFDHPNDDHGCEIYIIRIDGTDLRRLTDNDYCDYQPRWGP